MNIAIIGAGFTGLSAGYRLAKEGHTVTIFEKESEPGGLAIGYQEAPWDWSLEKHYHHWFTNDTCVLSLAKELHYPVIITRPKTTVYVDDHIYPFDSAKDILRFPKLPMLDKLRMGIVGVLLKYNPFWQPLEKINAATFIPITMGQKAYNTIWKPLFTNKFGRYANDISLAWFWARLTKRTFSLAYPQGGFLHFARHLAQTIQNHNGTIQYQTEVKQIASTKANKVVVTSMYKGGEKSVTFDKVIFTLSSYLFSQTAVGLPDAYKKTLAQTKTLGATNLILRLKKPFLKNNTYWVSVCDPKAPVMAVVEHTNFMHKKYYNNESIVYLGNYMPTDSPAYTRTKEQVLKEYDPFLTKLNPDYKKHLIATTLWKSPFAQPIIPTNYSQKIVPAQTPLPNVFLANMEQVYPWDRGTNYAIALGEKIAKQITS